MRDLDEPDAVDVLIVGGGAAGVLVALHLLRAGATAPRLCIVEPRARLGEGAAYSTRDPNHLLNVRAGGLSAFDDDPGHFVRASAEPAERFLPRASFAGYLRGTLHECTGGSDIHVRDEAVDVTGAGPYRVVLRSGRVVTANAVVLALGNSPRPLEGTVAAGAGETLVHGWDYPAVSAIAADSAVCVVGSGLSMVDVAMTLQANGHRGPIRVLSRHGLLPLPHASGHGPAATVDETLFSGGVPARMRLLRAQAKVLSGNGEPWQWAMDRLRPHGRRLWQSLDEAGRRRFLRHARPFWDIHRHRIAPEVASRLAELRLSGQLTVQAASVHSIETGPQGLRVRFRRRGSDAIESLQSDCGVACVGIESRLPMSNMPLLRALAARGAIAPGPLGLGLSVGNAAGALRDAAGQLQPRLLTLGSARIGQDWETTAIPEIRAQARAIAGWLRESGIIPATGL